MPTYYVNNTGGAIGDFLAAGNDSTGDGTLATPYQTIPAGVYANETELNGDKIVVASDGTTNYAMPINATGTASSVNSVTCLNEVTTFTVINDNLDLQFTGGYFDASEDEFVLTGGGSDGVIRQPIRS